MTSDLRSQLKHHLDADARRRLVENAVCLECLTDFPPTKPNKRFCSLQCRRRWHNRRWYPHRLQLKQASRAVLIKETQRG